MKVVNTSDNAIPDKIHAAGASTNMSRTCVSEIKEAHLWHRVECLD